MRPRLARFGLVSVLQRGEVVLGVVFATGSIKGAPMAAGANAASEGNARADAGTGRDSFTCATRSDAIRAIIDGVISSERGCGVEHIEDAAASFVLSVAARDVPLVGTPKITFMSAWRASWRRRHAAASLARCDSRAARSFTALMCASLSISLR